jgi:hypothetical protein
VRHFGEMNNQIDNDKSYILDIPYELFHLICKFLPLVDVRLCTLVCRTLYDWIKSSQTYQSSRYKKLIGHNFNYEVAKLGYLNILTSICNIKASLMNRKLYFAAIEGNHPEIVNWLLTQKIAPKRKIWERATTRNRIEIFQLILPSTLIIFNLEKCLYSIARNDNLDAFKILEKKYPEACKKIFDGIMCEWDNRKDIKLLSIITVALRYNNLSIADYCLKSFSSTHLEKFLSKKRCCKIIQKCNIDTYNWLINKFKSMGQQFLDTIFIHNALARGANYNLMMQLYENPTDSVNLRGYDLNLWKHKYQTYHNVKFLQWLYDHDVKFNVDCYREITYYTLDNTHNSETYLNALTWLYNKVGPDTTPFTANKIRIIIGWYENKPTRSKNIYFWAQEHGFNMNSNA